MSLSASELTTTVSNLSAQRMRLEGDISFKKGQLDASRMYIHSSQSMLDDKYAQLDVWIEKRSQIEELVPLVQKLEETKRAYLVVKSAHEDRMRSLENEIENLDHAKEELQQLKKRCEQARSESDETNREDVLKIQDLETALSAFQAQMAAKVEAELAKIHEEVEKTRWQTTQIKATFLEEEQTQKEQDRFRRQTSLLPDFASQVEQILCSF
eukprot:ANDGO_05532.mRNA.1 hypothetical protein